VTYARKTFSDSNPVKRYFQRTRLRDALRLVENDPAPERVIDFGAGNGELCKSLAGVFPQAAIVCYEPHPDLLAQARDNLADAGNVLCTAEIPREPADLVFCLEVFEHLPERETGQVTGHLAGLLRDGGRAIVGVPIEVGIPALYKGLFRMARRFGDHDARPGNILSAVLGEPPRERPIVELLPGSGYHLHHLGFDHRAFRKHLDRDFQILAVAASPFPSLGAGVNSELLFVVTGRSGVN
jgi:SAM-dependent methyltransferase